LFSDGCSGHRAPPSSGLEHSPTDVFALPVPPDILVDHDGWNEEEREPSAEPSQRLDAVRKRVRSRLVRHWLGEDKLGDE